MRVGDAVEFGIGESQPMGLASHNGTLYMAGGTNTRLYALNTVTGKPPGSEMPKNSVSVKTIPSVSHPTRAICSWSATTRPGYTY